MFSVITYVPQKKVMDTPAALSGGKFIGRIARMLVKVSQRARNHMITRPQPPLIQGDSGLSHQGCTLIGRGMQGSVRLVVGKASLHDVLAAQGRPADQVDIGRDTDVLCVGALKRPLNSKSSEESQVRERKVLTKTGESPHPNLQRALAFHPEGIITRLMVTDLGAFITAGPVSPVLAIRITKEIAQALKHLHGLGYAHLDLGVRNIFLDPAGHAQLSDFGRAESFIGSSRFGWTEKELIDVDVKMLGSVVIEVMCVVFSGEKKFYQVSGETFSYDVRATRKIEDFPLSPQLKKTSEWKAFTFAYANFGNEKLSSARRLSWLVETLEKLHTRILDC